MSNEEKNRHIEIGEALKGDGWTLPSLSDNDSVFCSVFCHGRVILWLWGEYWALDRGEDDWEITGSMKVPPSVIVAACRAAVAAEGGPQC
jgi:hypothetical protein